MKILWMVFSFIAVIMVNGCDNKREKTAENKHTIVVGTSPGPYSQLFLTAIKPILERQGYNVKDIDFTNLRQADVALNDGDIDINVDQHTAYYQDFNHNTGADLVAITEIPTVPAGIYSGRKSSLDKARRGDKIAIPDDPSNSARAYLLLQKAGLITLKQGITKNKVTSHDIENNNYGLDIIEMDSATIPRSLADLDYAVIPGSIVYSSKISSGKKLLSEDILKHLILVAVVKEKNKNTEWAKAVNSAYHSDEFRKHMNNNNNDFWYLPEPLN